MFVPAFRVLSDPTRPWAVHRVSSRLTAAHRWWFAEVVLKKNYPHSRLGADRRTDSRLYAVDREEQLAGLLGDLDSWQGSWQSLDSWQGS